VPVEWPGGELNASFEGAVAKFRSLHINRDTAAMVERTRLVTEGFTTTVTCPTCEGARAVTGGARVPGAAYVSGSATWSTSALAT